MKKSFTDVLFEVFDACDERRGRGDIVQVVPVIWGHQGGGKSSMVRQWAALRKRHFISIHLGQFDSPGDMLGMPEVITVKGGVRKTILTKPTWFPEEGQRAVLFVDEINRANNLVQQLLHAFLLDRRIGQHKLPKDCFIVAAANPPESQFQVGELDAAVMDRLLHIPLDADQSGQGWVGWAMQEHLDPRIIDIVSGSPQLIATADCPVPREAPTRRSWHMLSLLIKDNHLSKPCLELISAGLLGPMVAKQFMQHCSETSNIERPVSAISIMNEYSDKEEVRLRIKVMSSARFRRADLLTRTCEQLRSLTRVTELTDDQRENVRMFMRDIPEEFKASLKM